MTDKVSNVERAEVLLCKLTEASGNLSDREVAEALGQGALDNFLNAILDPDTVSDYPSIADFFLENRNRAALLALLRVAITRNYSYGVEKEGQTGYAAPSHNQWYEDAVMLVEGSDRFQGRIARYDGEKIEYMVAGRSIEGPAKIGPEDIEWISLEEMRRRLESAPQRLNQLVEESFFELRDLLDSEVNDEGRYQELLQRNPRAFRLQFTEIRRHEELDDDNIPDFTGTRARDGFDDILEIKPPFRPIFKESGDFRAEFLSDWNQAERYLGFVRRQRNYLAREKGLEFENARCYLIAGYDLTDEERRRITEKEEMNPAITLLTYEELARLMSDTLELLQNPPVEE